MVLTDATVINNQQQILAITFHSFMLFSFGFLIFPPWGSETIPLFYMV